MLEVILLFVMIFIMYSIIGVICGVVGYVFCNILLYEDILNWYGRWLGRLPEWLGKPLGLCAKCFTGQLTLWVTILLILLFPFDLKDLLIVPYTICLAIYITTKM